MKPSRSWLGLVGALLLASCAEGPQPPVSIAPSELPRPVGPTADQLFRPAGAPRDLRFPVLPGLCHADDSTLLGQVVLRNYGRNMAGQVISLQVSCNSGGVPRSPAEPATYQTALVGLIHNRIPRVGISEQAFANEVARENGDRVRTDVAAWDSELQRLAATLPVGENRRFAVLPSTEDANLAVEIHRINAQNFILTLSSLMALGGNLLSVESSYANFDKTTHAVAQMVTQHLAWLRAIRFANRLGA